MKLFKPLPPSLPLSPPLHTFFSLVPSSNLKSIFTFCRLCFNAMGKVELFTVLFAENRRTFYPGELINGTVLLKTNKDLKLRGVRIEFHGQAKVRWSESSGSGQNRRTHSYRNVEDYINTVATLYGKGKFVLRLDVWAFRFAVDISYCTIWFWLFRVGVSGIADLATFDLWSFQLSRS